MKDSKLRDLVGIALVAAIYVALTLALYPLSYGTPQFRLSECLVLLTYFNKKHGIGVTFGVFIANMINPSFAMLDLVFGTLSTAIAVVLICYTKRLFIATLWPTLTSLIVVFEIYYVTEISFVIILLEVMLSMFVIESIIGYLVFKLLGKNKTFLKVVRSEKEI